MQRESFRSRLGFLLVSAGCAIGIGNVWRFPYIAGLYGGGLFVLIYLICLLVMGVPVLTMELAVGRASKKSAVLAYKALEPKGSRWHIHGWFCLLGCVMLMMYYTTVTGWMVSYFGKFVIGTFYFGMDAESARGVFGTMLSEPGKMAFWTEVVVIAGFVTIVDLCLQAFFPDIAKSLGVFIPLIVVNCIVLGRAEAFASKNSVAASAVDGICQGIGYTVVLVIMCTVRELLGAGTLMGIQIMPASYTPALMLVLPVGGFLCLGTLIAVMQWALARSEKKAAEKNEKEGN